MPNSHFQSATSVAYWKNLNPEMPISDLPFRNYPPTTVPEAYIEQCFRNLKNEGYFQTPPVIDKSTTARLAATVYNIVSAGFPAVFSFVYDEFWSMIRSIEQIFIPTLGENYLVSPGDMWIWHIDEQGRSTGWGPHRDLLDTSSLRPDGSSRLLTVWIPLTDASPLNGCMYLVPTHLDPDYPDNLKERSVGVDTLQSIRALPAASGSLLG